MPLIYAREWNDIFNDPRTKSALPPLKLPKHQFFPLHLATLPTRPVPSLPFLAPCYLARPPFPPSLITVPKPIQERNSSSRVEQSHVRISFESIRLYECVCVWKGKRLERRGSDDSSTRVEKLFGNISVTKIFHVSHVVATRYYEMILALWLDLG